MMRVGCLFGEFLTIQTLAGRGRFSGYTWACSVPFKKLNKKWLSFPNETQKNYTCNSCEITNKIKWGVQRFVGATVAKWVAKPWSGKNIHGICHLQVAMRKPPPYKSLLNAKRQKEDKSMYGRKEASKQVQIRRRKKNLQVINPSFFSAGLQTCTNLV